MASISRVQPRLTSSSQASSGRSHSTRATQCISQSKAFLPEASRFSFGPVGQSCRRSRLSVSAAGFDPERMEVLGIPGVKIVTDDGKKLTRGQDGLLEKKINGGGQGSDEKYMPLELSWDPNSDFGDHAEDLIEKNTAKREKKEMEEQMEKEKAEYEKNRKELEAARAARVQPALGDVEGMITYLMDTEINELEFEMVRCRPLLTPEFFAGLERRLSEEEEDAEQKEKLETMAKATKDFVSFVDANVQALAAPAERLRDLLQAKDKKAKIMEMADKDEIDDALLALLQTNINMARAAKNDDACEFMQKIYNALQKFKMPVA